MKFLNPRIFLTTSPQSWQQELVICGHNSQLVNAFPNMLMHGTLFTTSDASPEHQSTPQKGTKVPQEGDNRLQKPALRTNESTPPKENIICYITIDGIPPIIKFHPKELVTLTATKGGKWVDSVRYLSGPVVNTVIPNYNNPQAYIPCPYKYLQGLIPEPNGDAIEDWKTKIHSGHFLALDARDGPSGKLGQVVRIEDDTVFYWDIAERKVATFDKTKDKWLPCFAFGPTNDRIGWNIYKPFSEHGMVHINIGDPWASGSLRSAEQNNDGKEKARLSQDDAETAAKKDRKGKRQLKFADRDDGKKKASPDKSMSPSPELGALTPTQQVGSKIDVSADFFIRFAAIVEDSSEFDVLGIGQILKNVNRFDAFTLDSDLDEKRQELLDAAALIEERGTKVAILRAIARLHGAGTSNAS